MEMKFQAFFQLQIMFTTSIIPRKHAASIKFDAKWLEKKLFVCPDGWRTAINWIIEI